METIEFLQQHLSAEPEPTGIKDYKFKPIAQRVKCKDGESLSVQASSGHYCAPREDYGPYYEVEVGFPSVAADYLCKFAEDADALTNTVYGYVPIELVARFIDAHGGPA